MWHDNATHLQLFSTHHHGRFVTWNVTWNVTWGHGHVSSASLSFCVGSCEKLCAYNLKLNCGCVTLYDCMCCREKESALRLCVLTAPIGGARICTARMHILNCLIV